MVHRFGGMDVQVDRGSLTAGPDRPRRSELELKRELQVAIVRVPSRGQLARQPAVRHEKSALSHSTPGRVTPDLGRLYKGSPPEAIARLLADETD